MRLGLGLGLARPTMAPYVPSDADAATYVTAVRAAGGLSDADARAVNDLAIGLKADGLWALARRINPMVGSALACAAVVLNAAKGAASDVLNNYVSGDWSPTAGLQGDGSTTSQDTGWLPLTADCSTGFWAACYRGTLINSGTRSLMGTRSAGAATEIQLKRDSPSYVVAVMAQQSALYSSAGLNAAIWSMQRVDPTDARLYQNNVQRGIVATTATALTPIRNLLMGACAYSTAPTILDVLIAGQRVAGYMLFDMLDATQRGNLQTRWATFNTAIGR